MKLIIDTTQTNIATFILQGSRQNAAITESYEFERGHNDKTLSFLKAFLKQNKIKPRTITRIQAYSGPGSYTGIRVGATIAQALGFAWNIPIKITAKK